MSAVTMEQNAQGKPLGITDTILRDAHQSQAATRMRTEDMLPACALLDGVGYWSLECWGGATFDACLRYLDEDPWERLRALKKALPHTRLQMLLRGQNILGYRNYADDVVDAFCRKSIENGVDVVRIFDALNDVRNLAQAVTSVKAYGGFCESAISYTASPIHNEQYFIDLALRLEDMGADALCIKDMANLLLPVDAYSLVRKLKARLGIPIHLHTHDSCGTGAMTYLMAVLAGVDMVDCALSPLAGGSSQPATESLAAALRGQPRDPGLDETKLGLAAAHFRGVAERLTAEGFLDPRVLRVDAGALRWQIPGGMLSNLLSQLKQAGAADKYEAVLEETPRVRRDFGYPPLVTPTSQIVGTQAVMNVLAGSRYKMVTKEAKALLRGEYGALPGPVDEAARQSIIGGEEVITCRPADRLQPELPALREQPALREALGGQAPSEEEVLSYALFPQVAAEFFRRRRGQAEADAETLAVITAAIAASRTRTPHPLIRSAAAPDSCVLSGGSADPTIRNQGRICHMQSYLVTVNGKAYDVSVEETGGSPALRSVQPAPAIPAVAAVPAEPLVPVKKPAGKKDGAAKPKAGVEKPKEVAGEVVAPLGGTVLSVAVTEGQQVSTGQLLLVFEAMKMENELTAPVAGVVRQLSAAPGQQLEAGAVVVTIA